MQAHRLQSCILRILAKPESKPESMESKAVLFFVLGARLVSAFLLFLVSFLGMHDSLLPEIMGGGRGYDSMR